MYCLISVAVNRRFELVVLLVYKMELRHESHVVAVTVDSYALDKGAQLWEEGTLQLFLKVETLAANFVQFNTLYQFKSIANTFNFYSLFVSITSTLS